MLLLQEITGIFDLFRLFYRDIELSCYNEVEINTFKFFDVYKNNEALRFNPTRSNIFATRKLHYLRGANNANIIKFVQYEKLWWD